jgi:hypothetical protein
MLDKGAQISNDAFGKENTILKMRLVRAEKR